MEAASKDTAVAGANTAVAAEGISDGAVRKAMALRVKYRLVDDVTGVARKEIPLSLLAVQPKNRAGIYPNGETVYNLCMRILKEGFSCEEANHAGVCVQELPPSQRKQQPTDQAAEYEPYFDYNRKKSAVAGEWLKDCFGEDEDIMYGTLSHSHLLLVLRGLLRQSQWSLSDVGAGLNDSMGRVSYAAVAAKDPMLADTVRRGLLMEVLSWKIYAEEPEGCSLISQALNKAQSMALRTTELTALAVLTGHMTLQSSAAVATRMDFEAIREKVRAELDVFVDEPEFVGLFDYILNLGVGEAGFVQRLLEFGETFVDPMQRRLRLDAFQNANKFPLEVPGVKVAVVMRAYRKEPQLTWCPSSESLWRKATGADLQSLEEVLHFFHVENKAAVAGMAASERRVFLANVNVQLAEACFQAMKNKASVKKGLIKSALPFHEQLRAHLRASSQRKDAELQLSKATWIDFAAVAAEKEKQDAVAAAKNSAANSPAKPAKLMPTIIHFDTTTGKPTNKQDTRLLGKENEDKEGSAAAKLPWQAWAKERVFKVASLEETEKAAIMLVLQALSFSTAAVAEAGQIELWYDSTTKQKYVTATKELKAKSLELAPCQPKSQSRLLKESTHPQRIRIRVVQKKPVVVPPRESVYYLQPEFKMPEDVTESHRATLEAEAGELAEDGGAAEATGGAAEGTGGAAKALAGGARAFNFHGDEVLSPYWAVERLTLTELRSRGMQLDFNLEFSEKEFVICTVCLMANQPCSVTIGVSVPVLTNPKDLEPGARLRVESILKPDKKRKRVEVDWKADVEAPSSSQAKKTASAKRTAAMSEV